MVVLCLVASNASADTSVPPIVIVGTDNNAPFSFSLPDGRPTGLYVEFWNLWSSTNNIPVKIVLGSFEEGLQAVKRGEAIHLGLFENDERSQWADYSLPIHNVDTGILYNNKYPANTRLKDMSDQFVAVGSNTFQADYLQRNMPQLQLKFHGGMEQAINALLDESNQLLVAEIPTLQATLARRGLTGVFTLADEILHSNKVHALVAKSQPGLLERVNRGIENMSIQDLIDLEKKWLPTLKPFFSLNASLQSLTIAERNWLQDHSTFQLGIESNWHPFEFLDGSGEFRGIAADYVSYASQKLNIELAPVKRYSWTEAFEALKRGDIDVMSGVVKNPERASLMDFTEPYIALPGVIVTRKNSFFVKSLSDLNNRKVGIIRGYILVDSLRQDFPDIVIQEVSSVADGLERVQRGELEAYVGSIAVVNYEIAKRQLGELMIAAPSPYRFELSMAVRKGLEPMVGILNKTFASMSERQKSAIANDWLSVHVQSGPELKTILIWAVPILSILSLIIFFISRINRKLKFEIATREQAEKERLSLEEQLHHSQKMEALGNLTGGIAHDFNNILGIIVGYSGLLKDQYQENTEASEFVDEIIHAGERGARLTGKLLSYTRTQALETTKLNINALLDQQQDMLQKALTVRIHLVIEKEPDLWDVQIDRNEFEDTVLNISINAMYAMRDKIADARLTISTGNTSIDETQASIIGVSAGDYVQLCLTDNGCGMNETIQEKLFDPFFSTKGEKGTGLGLSQVYGFMQRCNGTIQVNSRPGEGSQFTLFFPRFTEDMQDFEYQTNYSAKRGSESILVVDDEEVLLKLTSTMLTNQGYRTYTAPSAAMALVILDKNPIDLLISDIIMPETDGYQLATIVQKKFPQIKIQLMSGFTDDRHTSMVDEQLHRNIIYKPFNSEILCRSIRILLDKQ